MVQRSGPAASSATLMADGARRHGVGADADYRGGKRCDRVAGEYSDARGAGQASDARGVGETSEHFAGAAHAGQERATEEFSGRPRVVDHGVSDGGELRGDW